MASFMATTYGLRAWLVNAAVLFLALAAPATAAEPIRLLVLGDSLSAGQGLPAAEAFPAQLERALAAEGRTVAVINAGVSGDTTTGGLARLAWTLGERPQAVIVELGANDGLRGIEPRLTESNLDALLTELGRHRLPVLLAGMKAPPNLGRAFQDRFDGLFAPLAAKHGAILYPFFLDGVAAEPRLNQPDGIHPTAEGVGVIVRNILPSVRALLDRVQR